MRIRVGFALVLGCVLGVILSACSTASGTSSDLSGSTVVTSRTTEYRYTAANSNVYRIIFSDDQKWEYLIRDAGSTTSSSVYNGSYTKNGSTVTFYLPVSGGGTTTFTGTLSGDNLSIGSTLEAGVYEKL